MRPRLSIIIEDTKTPIYSIAPKNNVFHKFLKYTDLVENQ